MRIVTTSVLLAVAGAVMLFGATLFGAMPAKLDARMRCTMAPAPTLAVLRVERDTMLPYGGGQAEMQSYTSVSGRQDTLLARPDTPMPAARVRMLQLDSATRAVLVGHGITDSQPTVFIRAAPYGPDCRVRRWKDTIPFAVTGEVGFVRASLVQREYWIGDTPVFVIPEAWSYPYPRRGRPWDLSPDVPLASAEAMFGLQRSLDRPSLVNGATREDYEAAEQDAARRAMAWARVNASNAEMEPIRTMIRQAVLSSDWHVVQRELSRFRGTYRVEFDIDGTRHQWYFRTQPQLAYQWIAPGAHATTAAVLASPHISGYRLVGNAADSVGAFQSDTALRMDPANRKPLVWLAVNDRPTTAGNAARRAITGMLEFQLSATPMATWTALERFVPPLSRSDSLMMTRMNIARPRRDLQPRLPITLHMDARGNVRADSTFERDGYRVRVAVMRVDTTSARRRF
ncbi:MAG: hypothetical protein IBJ03_02390 [Gemmatimonadaceae bacterium]|nr:hypothetical protein [Gemmatimonadaceae bacterium]